MPGLGDTMPGLGDGQPDPTTSHPGFRSNHTGLKTDSQAIRIGQTDGRMGIENFSPFYRTLPPIGAAVLLPKGRPRPIKTSRAEDGSIFY